MKKSLLAVLLAVAMVAPVFASNWFVGGELGYNQERSYGYITDQTVKSFTVVPEIGCNLSEKWDLGLDFGFKYKDAEEANLTSRTYGVYPFVRYNVFSIGDFSILAKCSVGFYSGDDCFYDGTLGANNSLVSRGYSIGIAPVVTYKINDSWSISATLSFLTFGYNHDESQYKDGHTTKGDEVGFNLNDGSIANIGFQYHF